MPGSRRRSNAPRRSRDCSAETNEISFSFLTLDAAPSAARVDSRPAVRLRYHRT
ncbi:MAG: hypothetical protein INR71_06455 [Terriglobus roseus]|nr:hypothetical protein [Terriglobus roseus]